MRKRKMMGKVFAVAIAFLMIGSIVGGTLGATGVALADGVSGVSLHVPYFSQCDERWGGDQMGTPDCILGDYERPEVSCGCAVTCVAMVLNYYGVHAVTYGYDDYFLNDTNPKDLNQWLRTNNGYLGNNITWDRVEGYSNAEERGIDFVEGELYDWPSGINAAEVSVIRDELNSRHPVIVNVGGHWVVITGMKGDKFYINDPWYSERTTLSSSPYNNTIYGVRVYHGTPHASVMPSGLYAGSSDPGLVYFYLGGNAWTPMSTEEELGHAYAVLCLVEYGGHLYAGTTSEFGGHTGVGRVYRYEGGHTWTLVGDNMDGAVCSLAVYQGDLYAGTAWNGMKLYRYEGHPNWTQVIGSPVWSGTRALYVSHDYLLMGDIGWDYMGHWDGSHFTQDQTVTTGSCIYDYQDYGDYVYAAAYGGRMWHSSDGIHWSLAPGFESYYDGNMWELEEFRHLLYMSYNNGELWASDGLGRGTRKFTAPDGIISMTTGGYSSTGDPPYLYFGTGGDAVGYGAESTGIANVYCYDGFMVEPISPWDEFGAGVQVLYAIRPRPISWYLCSPADMIVTDPDGLTISKELNEIPGATYSEVDLDGDGDLDDVVNIPDQKIGDYLITVIPEPDASPTDTYTLRVSADGVTIVLAENVQIANIPAEGYIVRSTETGIMQIVPARIDFDPNTLNLKSRGQVVTSYIELPTGYNVVQIDISTVMLNGTVAALTKPTKVGDYDSDGIPDLMVKFNRAAVRNALTVGEEVEVTIAGEVTGIIFEGSDIIRLIDQ